MRVNSRLNPEDSNSKIRELLDSNKPFLISRVGLGGETVVSAFTMVNQPIPQQ